MTYKKASEIRLGDYIYVVRNHNIESEFVNMLSLNQQDNILHVNAKYYFRLVSSSSNGLVAFTDPEEARQHAKSILLDMLKSIEDWQPTPLI